MNAAPDQERPKKKRSITEARRRQSREAQKRYREKQKRQWAELLSFASVNSFNETRQPESITAESSAATELSNLIGAEDLLGQQTPVELSSTNQDIASVLDLSGGSPSYQIDAFDSGGTGLRYEGMLSKAGATITMPGCPRGRQSADRDDSSKLMPKTIQPQFSTLLHSSGPSNACQTPTSVPVELDLAPSIPADTHIHVRRDSFLNAFMQNAMVLGFTYDSVTTHGCHLQSMWCPPLPQPQSRVDWKTNLPGIVDVAPDLVPTTSQLQYPHGIYLDIFPFAEFREKTLALRAIRPKVFEEADLQHDLDSGDAVRCWGPTPWDRRSWEIEPWFLQKWWMLTGGEQGEMASSSRWWRRLRGEL